MIFLNALFLAGLAAVLVPLVIHLLNRVRARPVEWGAMRFLRQSLNVRRRRMQLEEALVLLVRCLAVALLALALARPFVRPASLFPPWMILGAILLPVALLAVGAAFWSDPPRRRIFLRASAVLLLLAAAAGWFEARRGGLPWRLAAGEKDVVLVLDASASMGLRSEGRSTFDRAVEEALALIESLPRNDAVGVVWAGPAPRVCLRPTADREALRKVLTDEALKPSAGSMGALESLYAAARLLEESRNPEKLVVFITDGHRAGWDFEAERRWTFLAERFGKLPVPPRLLIRRLPMPEQVSDAMVADIALSRQVVGPDRPVGIEAVIANAGTLPVRPGTVELLVDGLLAGRADIRREIPVGAVERVKFQNRFDAAGRHVLSVRLGFEDDSPVNNSASRALDVLERVPILLVDGSPAERFFRGAAGFLRVALQPGSDSANSTNEPLIRAEVKSVREFSRLEDLSGYAVVVLANVARMPDATAAKLAGFVAAGGGLLIAPGERAEPEFYNAWRTGSGGLVPSARLAGRQTATREEPFRLDRLSCSHPALRIPVETMPQDAGRFLSSVCWNLETDPVDRDVRVGARFGGGSALLAERTHGLGRILMTAIAMDRHDSNLPTLKSFVPFAHELILDLAALNRPVLHLKPGDELVLKMKLRKPFWGIDPAAVSRAAAKQPLALELAGPGSNRLAAAAQVLPDGDVLLRSSDTVEPGLYRLVIPASLRTSEPGKSPPAEPLEIPFSVGPSAEEARPGSLSEADLILARNRIGLVDAPDRQALARVSSGQAPGREMWRGLAVAALLGLLAEVALTRWVAIRRQTAAPSGVTPA
jgi:hypothetical protein